ncbi:MAG: polysaccharide pyruvyl transferase family protein [bacterium]|nr:polysaccharide pyruvyl transferase family protein [bacterium]
MKKQSDLKIALLGMFGGMWQEYNPGCFLVGYKIYSEIKKRFPKAKIDLFAIQNKLKGNKIIKENKFDLMPLNFFSRQIQIKLLENVLSKYDALIIGGDIVWGGDDVVADNDIFFINSKKFIASKKTKVLFNCIHTFYDDQTIKPMKEKFKRACSRAFYISVRTKPIQERLKKLGIKQKINFVPDIVLDFDLKKVHNIKLPKARTNKPKLGMAIRSKLANEFIEALKKIDLDKYEVYCFAYSQQYGNLKTVRAIKKVFKNRFHYLEKYYNPIESFKLIGSFDFLINDAFHGIIAATLQNVPFISIDVETEKTSRKDQLLESLGVSRKWNIRLEYNNPQNAKILNTKINYLFSRKFKSNKNKIKTSQKLIKRHFNAMEKIIKRCL